MISKGQKLKKYYSQEYQTFIKSISTQLNRISYDSGMLNVGFVNPVELEIIESLISDLRVDIYFGNSDEYEKRYVIVYDTTIFDATMMSSFVDYKILKIEYSKKFDELTHPKILGTLINSGYSFQDFGDIIVAPDKEFFIFVTNALYNHLVSMKVTFGRISVTFTEIPDDSEIVKRESHRKVYFVKSLRLDLFIKTVCKINRKDASNLIRKKDVRVNHQVSENISKRLELNDIISVRKYGKFQILSAEPTKSSFQVLVSEEK